MIGEAVYFIFLTLLTLRKELLIPVAAVAVCAIGLPAIIAAVGFTIGGVLAGSIAAAIQSSIGNVVAGSLFALLQSLGTIPLTTAGIGAAIGAVIGAVGLLF